MAACIPVKSLLIWLLVKKSLLLKMQQLILGTGTAIWWLTEPHSKSHQIFFIRCAIQFLVIRQKTKAYDVACFD
jgi:hypothetical protein